MINKEVFLKKVVKVVFILNIVVIIVGRIVIRFKKIELGSVILVVIVLMKLVVVLFGLMFGMKVFWCFKYLVYCWGFIIKVVYI